MNIRAARRAVALPLIIFVLLWGCTGELTIEEKLVDTIRDKCREQPCSISIAALTEFSWDRLYVFRYTATAEEMENVLGTDPGAYTEFSRRMVFTLNDNVVYYEQHSSNVEAVTENEIVFDIPDTVTHRIYTLSEAVFKASKQQSGGTIYYKLDRVHR